MYKDHKIDNDTQKAIDKLFDAFHDVVNRGFGVSISKNKSKSIYDSTIQILDLDKSVFAESLSNNEYFENKRGT
tara:strand:+ start:392 stop:613 length:222 start_codon:yes stop_codon:yes gene_type:complete